MVKGQNRFFAVPNLMNFHGKKLANYRPFSLQRRQLVIITFFVYIFEYHYGWSLTMVSLGTLYYVMIGSKENFSDNLRYPFGIFTGLRRLGVIIRITINTKTLLNDAMVAIEDLRLCICKKKKKKGQYSKSIEEWSSRKYYSIRTYSVFGRKPQ